MFCQQTGNGYIAGYIAGSVAGSITRPVVVRQFITIFLNDDLKVCNALVTNSLSGSIAG